MAGEDAVNGRPPDRSDFCIIYLYLLVSLGDSLVQDFFYVRPVVVPFECTQPSTSYEYFSVPSCSQRSRGDHGHDGDRSLAIADRETHCRSDRTPGPETGGGLVRRR